MKTPTIQSPASDLLEPTVRMKEIIDDLYAFGARAVAQVHGETYFNIQNVPLGDIPRVEELVQELHKEGDSERRRVGESNP